MHNYRGFRDFYPFYLSEHADVRSRRLHFDGSCAVLVVIAATLASGRVAWLWLVPLFGYGCAWTGHFFFEKNRPATFTHPIYSLMGDWVMFGQVLTGRVSLWK